MTDLQTLDELYAAFEGLHMEGGWHRKFPALWPVPEKNFLPHIWRYAEVVPILEAAGRLVSTEFAERRNLTLRNPVEGNKYATVRTLVAAYQMIRPGEVARAHRHTPNALRLILDGKGTYTTVEGERVEMRPGDVLLTPNWHWHSHENIGNEECYWLDFLDVPTVHLLEPMFFEQHPDGIEANPTTVEKSALAFRWEDSLAGLAESADDANGMCAAQIELGNPALDTVSLFMQRLSTGMTRQMQTTANSIFAVIEGSGATEVDGARLDWARGDIIAVPAWRTYRHTADQNSVLLRITDMPVFEKLGWLREQFS
jgi:gentisate 1,2-dioxygenase